MTDLAPTTRAPRHPRLAKRLGTALFVVLGTLVVLELAVRVRSYVLHGTFSPVHDMVVHAGTGLRIPVPGRVTGAITIDHRGFRNPELEVPKPAGRVRVAFLGASTTYCAEASSNEATWPALVTARLSEAHPETSFDYVNAGVVGYILAHVETTLAVRVKPLAPDVIVIYEATNDLTKDTRELAKEQGVYRGHADANDRLADVSMLWHLIQKNLLARQRADDAWAGHDRVRLDVPRLETSYRERYAHLVRAAQEVAPVVVVVTFAQRARRDMPPEELKAACVTHAYYMPYMSPEGILDGFDAYNRAIRSAAAETGAVLVEGEDGVPPDAAHFTDSVHFTDAGCRWQATRVFAGLDAAPAFRALLARVHDTTPAR